MWFGINSLIGLIAKERRFFLCRSSISLMLLLFICLLIIASPISVLLFWYYRRAGKPRPTLVVRRSQGSRTRYETPPAQHCRLSSASHARRAGTRERSSRYHSMQNFGRFCYIQKNPAVKPGRYRQLQFVILLLFLYCEISLYSFILFVNMHKNNLSALPAHLHIKIGYIFRYSLSSSSQLSCSASLRKASIPPPIL